MKLPCSPLILIAATAVMATSANAAQTIVAYSEAAGSFNTTLDGTNVFDFNTLNVGRTKNVVWSGVGVFDQLQINAGDKWGGAGNPSGSKYSVQSNNTLPITTLTLTSYHSYFGFYWSSGDADNVITFYDGSTQVGQFTTANFLNQIASTSDYYGNPVSGTFHGHGRNQVEQDHLLQHEFLRLRNGQLHRPDHSLRNASKRRDRHPRKRHQVYRRSEI
jgi:hypothetical protein